MSNACVRQHHGEHQVASAEIGRVIGARAAAFVERVDLLKTGVLAQLELAEAVFTMRVIALGETIEFSDKADQPLNGNFQSTA